MSTDGFRAAPPPPEEVPPPEEENPLWLWWAAAAIALVLVLVLVALTHLLGWSLPSNLWFNYAWASDKSNGPEALQQTILYGAVAILLVPPIRHWLGHEFHKVHAKIDLVHETVKDHHEQAAQERAAHRTLLHHIILSTDGIDNVVPGLDPEFQPPQPEETQP